MSSNIQYTWTSSDSSNAQLSTTSGQSTTLTTKANRTLFGSNKTYTITLTVTFTKGDGTTATLTATGTFIAVKGL